MGEMVIRRARENETEEILRLTQEAFAAQDEVDPPSSVFAETADVVRQAMSEGTIYVAVQGNELVGAARVKAMSEEPALICGRLAVRPSAWGQGIGGALVARFEEQARAEGYPATVVGVRIQLTGNLRFFQKRGYRVYGEHSHPGYDRTTYLRLRKDLDAERDQEPA